MNIENTKAQMRKGVLEFCILSILSDGEHYPTEIIERMKAAKLLIVEGTLYPLLTRLKNDGLLAYRWEESTSGPPRKYFTLTDQGRENLAALVESWTELTESVNQILHQTNQPKQETHRAHHRLKFKTNQHEKDFKYKPGRHGIHYR